MTTGDRELLSQDGIARRTFLKLAGIAGLGGSSLLVGCGTAADEGVESAEGATFSGNTNAAVSTGLPYGADKIVPTLCGCGDVCGLPHTAQVYVKDGKIVYYEGCDEGFNKGALCARGMAGLSIINSPDRVKYPMRRTNAKGVKGEFKRITWDEAIEEVAEAMATAIKEDGPQSVFIGGAHAANHGSYFGGWLRFFNTFSFDAGEIAGGCYNDLKVGPYITLGDYYHCMEEDPSESRLLIMWGENDVLAKPQEWADSFAKAKHEHGATIVCIDPRFSETAQKSDIYLPLRPGSDAYLALAMANVIITEGLEDKKFIEEHTYGYAEFKELALKYTPELVEKITWTPADRIRQVARMYATMKPAMLCIGRGGNQAGSAESDAGWMMSRAITCLIGLTGQAGMKGAAFTMEASVGTADGLWFHWPTFASIGGMLGGLKPLVERTQPRGGTWTMSKALYYGDPHKYRVFMGSNNLAASGGDQNQASKAFQEIPLVVTYNRLMHWTASQYADIVFPISSWAEQAVWRADWEVQTFTAPAIEPMFESRSDNDLLRDLSRKIAEKLELGLAPEEVWPLETDEDVIKPIASSPLQQAEYAKRVAEGHTDFEKYIGLDVQKAYALPGGVAHGPFYANLPDFIPYKAKLYTNLAPAGTDPEDVFFPTYKGNGKLLFKADWLPELNETLPALPVPCEPCDSYYAAGNPIESGNWEPSEAVKAGYTFVAVGKGHKFWQFLSFNQNTDGGPASPWHREAFASANEPCVEMNPHDVEQLGLAAGDYVTIESQYGKMEQIRVLESRTIQPSTIVPPYHWGNVQNRIYPLSLSLERLTAEQKTKLHPQIVGEWGKSQPTLPPGGQNTQTAVLCKIYKA